MLLRLQNSYASMNEMMRAQERTANNLANANTVGYRADRSFTTALNERLDEESAPRTDRVATQWADQAAGSYESTGNPLDVAISGEGFFALQDEETGASRYSRAGRFVLDAEGTLRDAGGLAVEGEGGPIQIPNDGGEIAIASDGEITVDGQSVGKLRVVRFENPSALRRLDGAALDAGEQIPEDIANPQVRQGFVEGSNVDPMKEMINMISQFRLFESQQKAIQSSNQILSAITRDLGRF